MTRLQSRRLALMGLLACAGALPATAQQAYVIPLENAQLLEQLMPAPALVARARIGDVSDQGVNELLLGTPWAPGLAKAQMPWKNGVMQPFRLTYDGLGQASLVVGSQSMSLSVSGDFEALAITAHSPGPATRARAYDLLLDGVPVAEEACASSAFGADAFDGLLIGAAGLQDGFVLEGKLKLAWLGTPPLHSFNVQVHVGSLAEQVEPFCPGTPNSTGSPCRMDWWGTSSISGNSFSLFAEDGPAGAVCLFLVGATTQSVPFGNGTLCVGAPIERLGDFLRFDAQGRVDLPLDLQAGSFASGPLGPLPGETRSFQVWYRDPQAAPGFFNLSDALLAHFLP